MAIYLVNLTVYMGEYEKVYKKLVHAIKGMVTIH